MDCVRRKYVGPNQGRTQGAGPIKLQKEKTNYISQPLRSTVDLISVFNYHGLRREYSCGGNSFRYHRLKALRNFEREADADKSKAQQTRLLWRRDLETENTNWPKGVPTSSFR